MDVGALAGLERDSVVLTAEERRWGRRRVKTSRGRELVLALPTGSVLLPGDLLYRGAGWYVTIEAAAEPVLAVAPRSRDEALRVAFEVGNRHFALAIEGERLLVPRRQLDGTAAHPTGGSVEAGPCRLRARRGGASS